MYNHVFGLLLNGKGRLSYCVMLHLQTQSYIHIYTLRRLTCLLSYIQYTNLSTNAHTCTQTHTHTYYRVITTVEQDTGKCHEFIAGNIVYECAARVNNTGGNERVYPKYRVHTVVIMLLLYANVKSDWSRTKPHPLKKNRARAPKHA